MGKNDVFGRLSIVAVSCKYAVVVHPFRKTTVKRTNCRLRAIIDIVIVNGRCLVIALVFLTSMINSFCLR